MDLTCSPRSGATPTGNMRSTVRHLDAETNWPGAELELDWPSDVADDSATGAAATISKQHGATVSTTGATLATTGLRRVGGEWMDISPGREEHGGRRDDRSQQYRRPPSVPG